MTTSTQRKSTTPSRAETGPTHTRHAPVIEPESEISVEADQPFAEGVQDGIDPDLRHRMISEAAYHLYAERGYAEGYDTDDWLQAEAAVDHVLVKPAH